MKPTVRKHHLPSKLIITALFFSVLSVRPVYADYFEEEDDGELPEKCTAVYVGKDVSAEGTRIIARSVIDVMTMIADRYEGTKYDMAKKANVHIVQTFDELPVETCQLQWLAMADAKHAIFVPAFSGISDTYRKY